MYSLVMLAALSPGADITPAPAPVAAAPVVAGCCGMTALSCSGSVVSYGCSGSCYGSCHGGCYGSCHGGHFGKGGMFGKHKHSCQGCTGYSCTGYNCFGSCSGCAGYSCSGWSCGGFSYGSTWGPPVGMPPYTLHGYNQGGGWGYGPPVVYGSPSAVYGTVTHVNPNPSPAVVVGPATTAPAPTATGTKAEKVEDKKADDKKADDKKTDTKTDDKEKKSGGASLKFRLPAEAKLYVDGRLTTLGGAERVFTTPPLAAGRQFFYDVKAELLVDGKVVVEEMRVVVYAGADLTESFPKLFAAAEGKGPTVAGK